MAIDIQEVTALIEEAAQTLVLPRFARLSTDEVEAKATIGDPEDVVTIVDREVEAHLTRGLAFLTPSAVVIGEEAASHRPELLDALASDQPLWLIDPIDGTKNFVAGDSGFGIMVAYLVEGLTRAAWVALPARRQTFVAEEGSGAFLNGNRVRVASAHEGRPRGSVFVRYMPGSLGKTVTDALDGHVEIIRPSGSAAVEYTETLTGLRDFVLYYRLLPWDHAAPAFVLAEGGGHVGHFNNQPYTARSASQLTIVARDRALHGEVRDRLRTHLPSGC